MFIIGNLMEFVERNQRENEWSRQGMEFIKISTSSVLFLNFFMKTNFHWENMK